MRARPLPLRPAGSLHSTDGEVLTPDSLEALQEEVLRAAERGSHLTLVAARRSFGEQFLPAQAPESNQCIDLSRLPVTITPVEETEGGLWVRASGWASFGDLMRRLPGHYPIHPPSSPLVTLAGALVGACHGAAGYFLSHVRAFRLLTAAGDEHLCSAESDDALQRALFERVPGSYGALGVVTEVELFVRKAREGEFVIVDVVNRDDRGDLRGMVAQLEEIYRRDSYPPGRVLYMCRGGKTLVILGDRMATGERPSRQLPLSGGTEESNILLQALSSRFPKLSNALQPTGMRPGMQYWAEVSRFLFFQSSYDQAEAWLRSSALRPRLLRALGVRPELPVVHQTWVLPTSVAAEALELFAHTMRDHSPAHGLIELQDLIRLPHCPAPLHPLFGYEDGAFLFTPSAAARTAHAREWLVAAYRAFTRVAWEQFGAQVLLLKQVHADDEVLHAMHASTWSPLWELKDQVDPGGVFTSRFLERLRQQLQPR